MAEPLPAPPIDTDADLTDFEYMPLEVRTLRDAGISVEASGDEFRAAVLLWCAAWHQIPAGSLPNSDIELSNLAGYGRVVKEWRKVKAGAMRGWSLHSDGRLYHLPKVNQRANEAWRAKLQVRYERELERLRKENKRRAERGETLSDIPTFDAWNTQRKGCGQLMSAKQRPPETPALPPETQKIPPDNHPPDDTTSAGIPPENALKRSGSVSEVKPSGSGVTPTGVARASLRPGKPDGDRSPENQRPKPDLPKDWWRSNEGIEGAAKIVGITPNLGELHGTLKRRVFDLIAALERHA